MSRKPSSKRDMSTTKVGPTSKVAKMSKTGDMPDRLFMDGTIEDYNRLFEGIDKYYEMPGDEWLKEHRVSIDKDVERYEITETDFKTWRSVGTGKYRDKRHLRVQGRGRSVHMTVHSPIGATESAVRGHIKSTLWHALKGVGELDKTQFIKRSSSNDKK